MSSRRRRSISPPSLSLFDHLTPVATLDHASLYVVAQEASLIRGQEAIAHRMEGRVNVVEGGRMVRWQQDGALDEHDEIWIDRYDVLNLLRSLPHPPLPTSACNIVEERECDDEGFSDLASDAEEMFYFAPAVRESIGREKRRNRMERAREDRVRAREKMEAEEMLQVDVETDHERPPSAQHLLMTTLSTTLDASDDPSLLEIRILANHGNDDRFAFLRKGGRWRTAWESMRSGATLASSNDSSEGAMGLVDYDSSEEEAEEGEDEKDGREGDAPYPPPDAAEDAAVPAIDSEDEKRLAKARKVQEWARKRKEARDRTEE